ACRAAGIELEWRGADGLCTRQVCDGIATHPHTGEPVFFNQIQLHHPSCLDPSVRRALVSVCGADALPRDVRFGDGGPIEDEVALELVALYERLAVRFPWQRGDLLMVDNMLVAHGRYPYEG